MTGETIERVAKAIVTAMFDDIPPESDLWNAYVGPARAAIEAMREPTEAMITAAAESWGIGGRDQAKWCWRAMIAAALATPPENTNPPRRPKGDGSGRA